MTRLPTTIIEMADNETANIEVYYLLINDKKETIGDTSVVKISPEATILGLKKKLKDSEDFRDELQHVSTTKLFVWRCSNPKLFSMMEWHQLQENMNKVDYTGKTNVTRLGTGQAIKELHLSDRELLLIEVLGECNTPQMAFWSASLTEITLFCLSTISCGSWSQ